MRLVWAWLGVVSGLTAFVGCNAVNGLGDYAFDLGDVGGAGGATNSSTTTSSSSSSGAGGMGGAGGGAGGDPSCGPCLGMCVQELTGFDDGWLRLSDDAADTPQIVPHPDGDIVVLTTSEAYKQGTIFWPQPILTNGFTVRFELRIDQPPMNPGDGLAFVVQQANPQLLGLGFSGFGLTQTGNDTAGVLFEVDNYNNGVECDSADPHIGMSGLATTLTNVNCDRTPEQIVAQPIPGLSSTEWYRMEVTVTSAANGEFDYRISIQQGNSAPIEMMGTHPAQGLFDSTAPHYFGFGAATGVFFERHEVRNAVITFPEPVCLE